MTKTDDVLLELDREVARYIKGVHTVKYKGKTYRLIDNYIAVPYMRCGICGNYPTFEVSVIESEEGKTLKVGNNCIDNLIGQEVSENFRNFRRKRENAMETRECSDEP